MQTLRFKHLKLANFLSIGGTPLELKFKEGLNLITGYNKDNPDEKNGIGKSSICDGLFFALYNSTIKDLKMTEIVNDKTKKGCVVELDFTITKGEDVVDYKIVRGLKPSICTFTVDGVDKTLSTIPKTNNAIANELNISKDLFKQSIIMSIGKNSSFFTQGKIEKRKFIEGIFNLEIFSEMLVDSRSGFNETKKEKENVSLRLGSEKSRCQQYIEKDESFESNKAEYITMLECQIKSDIIKAKELAEGLKDVKSTEELSSKLEEISSKMKKIDEMNLYVGVKLSEINKEISSLQNAIADHSDVCEACNRRFDDVDSRTAIKSQREARIVELTDARVDFTSKKGKIKDKNDTITKDRDDVKFDLASIKSAIDNNKTIKSHISTIKISCQDNRNKIDSKKCETSDFADLISKTTKDIEALEDQYKAVYADNKVFDICKFILSEEGVKSVIIKRLKSLLNTKLNEYLDMLGSEVTCEFDEYFSETIYNKNGVEKSYDAFSGGESKRIDLAILLTFQDILKEQSGIDIKLGIYDEILDTSIDESGRKLVLRILKGKSENTPTYIISHRAKMSDLIDHEIILVKHNDYTFLKEIR